jgi:hypothetical protein
MLPYRDSKLTKILLGIFFLLVIGYAYFEAQGILFGPSISISSKITEVRDPFITLKGQADRISSLSMNGKEIQVTESGAFEEPYLLAEGLNRIVLDAKDKYGRRAQKIIEVVYTPAPSNTGQMTATTSAATTTSQ